MPWDALPEHLNSPEKWKGTDWDNGLQRWLLKFKGWFAYGPRSKHKWAQWDLPKCIIGLGVYRWEAIKLSDLYLPLRKFSTAKSTRILREDGYFPSVVQYWSRAHFLLTYAPGSHGFGWHLSLHFFWPWANPTKFPERSDFTIKEMFSFRIGARFDKDFVHWFPSAAVGGDFV